MLVKGRAGLGKSCLIRHVRDALQAQDKPVFWVPDAPTKATLEQLLRQLHESLGLVLPVALLGPRVKAKALREGGLQWHDLARTLRRLPVAEASDIVIATLRKASAIVCFDALEVPAQKAELFVRIMEVAQVLAGMDDKNRRVRIERMLWRFQTVIELRPLALESCEQITRNWLAARPLRFSDDRTRTRFIRHVAQDSGGVPAAIRGMLEKAEKEREITPALARSFTHAAGVRYLDMTPVLILMMVVAMAGRYVSRGIGETEMLVLSGVATALFMGLRFFFWQMRMR